MSKRQPRAPELNDEEVALFCNAIGVVPRKMGEAARELVEKYDLGHRGAWILAMINGGLNSPSRLSDALCIGRSLFTAELSRLVAAGLVKARKDSKDGRRLLLELTPEGLAANKRLQKTVNGFVNDNLSGFSREDVQLCTRLLLSFVGSASVDLGGPVGRE